jgi:peptide/nickel transport system permease protein
MTGYVLRRLLMTIPTLLLVSLAVFVLVRLIPGDPVSLMFGDGGTPEQIARGRAALGLDQPVFVQFWRWLTRIAVGDFGNTITDGQAVLPLILERFQVSASVVLVSVAMAAVVGVTIGIIAAWKQDSKLDVGIVGLTTVILSIPTFWLGLLLLLLFGLKLGWLPVIGYVPISEDPWKAMLFLLLPVATLTLHESGVVTRMARASAIEAGIHHPCPRQGPERGARACPPCAAQCLRANMDTDRPDPWQPSWRHCRAGNRVHSAGAWPASG